MMTMIGLTADGVPYLPADLEEVSKPDERFRSSNHIRPPCRLVGPGVDDRFLIEEIHGGYDAILEFLFRCDADVAQDGWKRSPR